MTKTFNIDEIRAILNSVSSVPGYESRSTMADWIDRKPLIKRFEEAKLA